MSEKCLEIVDVTKRFAGTPVINRLSLNVPRGSIYAFLGRNGEGKTTTIKLIMNMLSADSGSIKIFGKDSKKDSQFIKSKIGYVPETPHLYDWMSVQETIQFTSRFYGSWNPKIAADLLKSLDIAAKKKVQELSLGTRAKLGLLLALSHEPELLVLDDCTSGLDATVRREFLEQVVTLVEAGTRTIFFSSHIITELERVADQVGLLEKGTLAFEMPLEELKNKVKKIHIITEGDPPPDLLKPYSDQVLRSDTDKNEIKIITSNYSAQLVESLKKNNIRSLDVVDLELEDIFVEYTRKS